MSKDTFLQEVTLAYSQMRLEHLAPVFKYGDSRASIVFDPANLRTLVSTNRPLTEELDQVELHKYVKGAAERMWAAYTATQSAAYNTVVSQVLFNVGARGLAVGFVTSLQKMFAGQMKAARNVPIQYAVPLAMCMAVAETTSDITSAVSSVAGDANVLRYLSSVADYHSRWFSASQSDYAEVSELAFVYGYAACALSDRGGAPLEDEARYTYTKVFVFLLTACAARPSVSSEQSVVLPGYIQAPASLPLILDIASPSWNAKLSFEAFGRTFVAGASPFLKNASFMVKASSASFMTYSLFDYLDVMNQLPIEGVTYGISLLRAMVAALLKALELFGIRSPIYFEAKSVLPDPKAESKFEIKLAGVDVSVNCTDLIAASDTFVVQKVREHYFNGLFAPFFFTSILSSASMAVINDAISARPGFRPTPDQYAIGVQSIGQFQEAATQHIVESPLLLSQDGGDLPILVKGVPLKEAFNA